MGRSLGPHFGPHSGPHFGPLKWWHKYIIYQQLIVQDGGESGPHFGPHFGPLFEPDKKKKDVHLPPEIDTIEMRAHQRHRCPSRVCCSREQIGSGLAPSLG